MCYIKRNTKDSPYEVNPGCIVSLSTKKIQWNSAADTRINVVNQPINQDTSITLMTSRITQQIAIEIAVTKHS